MNQILAEIDAQIAKLQQARALLAGTGSSAVVKRGPGRPPKSAGTKATVKPRKRRQMSAEARKRIADAQKRRWAEAKKSKA